MKESSKNVNSQVFFDSPYSSIKACKGPLERRKVHKQRKSRYHGPHEKLTWGRDMDANNGQTGTSMSWHPHKAMQNGANGIKRGKRTEGQRTSASHITPG